MNKPGRYDHSANEGRSDYQFTWKNDYNLYNVT